MRLSLAEISKPMIESLPVGNTGREWAAQPPFTDTTCFIPRFLEKFSDREGICWNRVLAFRLNFAIAPDVGMARMQASHQTAAGWGADRAAE